MSFTNVAHAKKHFLRNYKSLSDKTFVHELHNFPTKILLKASRYQLESFELDQCIEPACRLKKYKHGLCVLHEYLFKEGIA